MSLVSNWPRSSLSLGISFVLKAILDLPNHDAAGLVHRRQKGRVSFLTLW